MSVIGDIDVQSVVAGSLPTAHPSIVQRNLELLTELKAPPLAEENVELFIGILSAGSHFTALHGCKEILDVFSTKFLQRSGSVFCCSGNFNTLKPLSCPLFCLVHTSINNINIL